MQAHDCCCSGQEKLNTCMRQNLCMKTSSYNSRVLSLSALAIMARYRYYTFISISDRKLVYTYLLSLPVILSQLLTCILMHPGNFHSASEILTSLTPPIPTNYIYCLFSQSPSQNTYKSLLDLIILFSEVPSNFLTT